MIKKVTKSDDFQLLAKLLNDAYLTETVEFGITKENCPTNTAFIRSDQLEQLLTDKREFFKFVYNNKVVGFIAIEKSEKEKDTFYIEKVAVHVDYRHKGIGKQLMDFAVSKITELDGKRISIGLVNANTKLKNWYSEQGFSVKSIKRFNHLPFVVCIMEKMLDHKEKL